MSELEDEWLRHDGTRKRLKDLVEERERAVREVLAAAGKSTDPQVAKAHARWETLQVVITRFGGK